MQFGLKMVCCCCCFCFCFFFCNISLVLRILSHESTPWLWDDLVFLHRTMLVILWTNWTIYFISGQCQRGNIEDWLNTGNIPKINVDRLQKGLVHCIILQSYALFGFYMISTVCLYNLVLWFIPLFWILVKYFCLFNLLEIIVLILSSHVFILMYHKTTLYHLSKEHILLGDMDNQILH